MPAFGLIRLIALLAALVLVASLFHLGSQPVAIGLFDPPLDKVAHFATFSMITALLWVAVFRGCTWRLIILVCCIGLADELHQMILPGRIAGLDDLAVDIVSVVLTALLLAQIDRRRGNANA